LTFAESSEVKITPSMDLQQLIRFRDNSRRLFRANHGKKLLAGDGPVNRNRRIRDQLKNEQ
jgi:hypothetical protein